jgi:hypothetical protein
MKQLAATMLACGILLGALPALADETCTQEISGGTINGNVVVPTGSTCTLSGVTVTGNVIVQTNAALDFIPGTLTTIGGNVNIATGSTIAARRSATTYLIVNGNVTATQCAEFDMGGFNIGGNITVQNCTDTRGVGISGDPASTIVDGNFTCTGNVGGCVLDSVTVQNNVTVNNNGAGSVVASVVIGGNLSCAGNTGGVSDITFPNTVGGKKTGQCAGL